MKMLPPNRPAWPKEKVAQILNRMGIADPVVIFGRRGYYRDSMGSVGKNDRGIYDDAIFVYSQNAFVSFNGNTDPSQFRHGVATLLPGVHLYRKGRHGISRGPGYPALRPATPGEALPVSRDGIASPRPGIAINIHKGGYGTTSSEGCQTIYPTQWAAFIALVYSEMDRNGVKTIPYVLSEGQG